MPLLEVERVSKAFGGLKALREVSLTLAPGECLGVMGPNGSGKTTLLNLIAGALAPDSGRIRLRGEEIAGLPPHRICARGVARTFQLVRPFPGLSALDNVLVGQRFGRAPRSGREAVAEAQRLLELVGLGGKGGCRAADLTLVERKRLELARALATAPSLLLLDEFLAGLSPRETETTMALLRRLVADGIALVMVEHVVWALMDLCPRIVVLNAGEKIAEGAPGAVASDPAVVAAYLGGVPRA
ncbi:MAG TPA: ABC transporter ATP-binding protein [Thermodesulfobacteriota bacterium]|nr:ABC transporter ATP-binding protein [Thermodesulfobacteriota bacterium]